MSGITSPARIKLKHSARYMRIENKREAQHVPASKAQAEWTGRIFLNIFVHFLIKESGNVASYEA